MKPPEQEVPPQEKQEIIPILEETWNKVAAAIDELDEPGPVDTFAAQQHLEESIHAFNQNLEILKGVGDNMGRALDMLKAGEGGTAVKQQLNDSIVALNRLLGK